MPSEVLLSHSPPCTLGHGLLLEHKPHQFAYLVSQLVLGLPSHSLSSMGTTGGPPNSPSIHVGAEYLNSNPYACVTSSAATELSPRLQIFPFSVFI